MHDHDHDDHDNDDHDHDHSDGWLTLAHTPAKPLLE
jgi:hypothetical protein